MNDKKDRFIAKKFFLYVWESVPAQDTPWLITAEPKYPACAKQNLVTQNLINVMDETQSLSTPAVVAPSAVSVPSQDTQASRKITELIASYKLVRRSSDNSEVYLVTTAGNKEVWVPKAQFETDAVSITFTAVKKGETWKNPRTGATGVYQADAYQFSGLNSKRDEVDTKTQILQNLFKAGFKVDVKI